ncbi:hypothetical protein KCP77_19400 [Salmonella enterica subsp. enterica]|nr:hypothetical protein KCP77_19400 [Salmonella enterica subsp. enterica]
MLFYSLKLLLEILLLIVVTDQLGLLDCWGGQTKMGHTKFCIGLQGFLHVFEDGTSVEAAVVMGITVVSSQVILVKHLPWVAAA